MESADCTASDGDEGERKNRPGKDRSAAVGKARQGRHVQRGTQRNDSEREQRNGSELHKCAQIITRCEQQPYRQSGCGKTVNNDENCECRSSQRENRSPRWLLRNPLSTENRGDDEHKSKERAFENFAGANASQIN